MVYSCTMRWPRPTIDHHHAPDALEPAGRWPHGAARRRVVPLVLSYTARSGTGTRLYYLGRKGTISEAAIRTMAARHARPMVFPLSNPTSQAEITPAEAYEWTDGRAIVATGSPFDPVERNGQTFTPSQCNNMYIFPGVGLGASVCAAETIPDSMLYHAAVALSQMTSDDELGHGRVFPPITNIRDASQHVAVTVAKHAAELNIARERPARNETVEEWMQRKMYYPEYVPIYSTNEP